MTKNIEQYFTEQYEKANIKIVPGHHPDFKTKKQVDKWISELDSVHDYIDDLLTKRTEQK